MADRLVLLLQHLQGVGETRATQMAEQIRAQPVDYRQALGALIATDDGPATCPECGDRVGDQGCPCARDPRDPGQLIVVRTFKDAAAVRDSQWAGWVHVLRGLLDPDHGVRPAQLTTRALLVRLRDDRIRDVVLAIGSDERSRATESWLADLLRPVVERVWGLGHGVQSGHDLEYATDLDIRAAFDGRRPVVP